jgi:hypothetical protein
MAALAIHRTKSNDAAVSISSTDGKEPLAWKAGDETRTHDIQLGKLTFYH